MKDIRSDYLPDYWVVVKIIPKDGTPPHERVLCCWVGGYCQGDAWKISSGIEETIETESRYFFRNTSGSMYECPFNHYGMNSYLQSIFNQLGDAPDITVELVESYDKRKR